MEFMTSEPLVQMKLLNYKLFMAFLFLTVDSDGGHGKKTFSSSSNHKEPLQG